MVNPVKIHQALTEAIRSGKFENFLNLLEKDPECINFKELENGKTALHIAAEKGDIEIAELLLKKEGIDVNIKSNDGRTALMESCKPSKQAIAKLLLGKAEVDVNIKSNDGTTALMESCKYGALKATRSLLKKSADINAENLYEQTPVTLAAKSGQHDIVKELIRQKCDVTKTDKSGINITKIYKEDYQIYPYQSLMLALIDLAKQKNISRGSISSEGVVPQIRSTIKIGR